MSRTWWAAMAMVALLLLAGAVIGTGAGGWRAATGQDTPEASGGSAPAGPGSTEPGATTPVPAMPGSTDPAPQSRVPYTGPVEHIFFHPLVVYPNRAFKGSMAVGYNDWFVTVREFDRIIRSLYQNGYVLVDIRSLYAEETRDGKAVLVRKPLLLPPNKKPLVLSIDDMNYYDYMREHGNAYRLILDADGNTATESFDDKGERVIAYDNEIVPILDSFVAAHPDFSLDGAKGLIALTGYQGVLGYRTNDPNALGYAREKAEALRLIRHLKDSGWSFAAHGWGHLDAAKIKYETLVRDTTRWRQEVESLVGPTAIYVYPFGSQVLPSDPKFQYLLGQGFRMFCSVGGQPFLQVAPGYVRMDRRHIDGLALHSQRSLLLPLFDADTVIEQAVRSSQY